MLEFLYRKIVNNIWLFLCLLIGALFACGVMSSIPLYSNAVLQKVLTRDLENYHVKNQVSPGTYSVQLAGNRDYEMELVNQINDIAERQLAASYNLPVTEKYYKIRTNSLNIRREGDDFFNEQRISGSPVYIEGYENNIELLYGRMPRGNTPEGVFEVAVTLGGLNRMQLLQDQEYTLEWSDFFANNHVQLAKFKVVGIFTVKDTNSLFWSGGRYRNLNDSILISAEQLDSLLESEKYVKISGVEKTWFFDYHSVKIGDVDRIIETTEEQYRWNEKNGKSVRLSLALLDVLENYMTRKVQLRITLWILTIPMMLIICFHTISLEHLHAALIITPSSSIYMLSATSIMLGSWVHIITVIFSWTTKSLKSLTTLSPVFVSSSAVGSSARRSIGLWAIALAIATLCCSPPDISPG
jgi:putative ABC transport system permease protein